MTADEFLALLARQPLPWVNVEDVAFRDASGVPVLLQSIDEHEIADAAPAMAAAIIRLLRAHLIRHDHGGPEAYQDALDKMRAALPAELRVKWPGDP